MPYASTAAETETDYRNPTSWATLAVFIALVVCVGGLIGAQAPSGAWYDTLSKPPFTPPDWAFAPVWFALYMVIAGAGWRIWMAAPRSLAMWFWVTQMLCNWLWSPVFFGAKQPWPAFGVLLGMWISIVGFMLAGRRHDTLATWLFVPYLIWVSYAGYLNLAFALLN